MICASSAGTPEAAGAVPIYDQIGQRCGPENLGPSPARRNETACPICKDVNSDQQNGGLGQLLTYDRVTAAKNWATVAVADQGIYSAVRPIGVRIIYNNNELINTTSCGSRGAAVFRGDPSGTGKYLFSS